MRTCASSERRDWQGLDDVRAGRVFEVDIAGIKPQGLFANEGYRESSRFLQKFDANVALGTLLLARPC
jgi:hypothetical protein